MVVVKIAASKEAQSPGAIKAEARDAICRENPGATAAVTSSLHATKYLTATPNFHVSCKRHNNLTQCRDRHLIEP